MKIVRMSQSVEHPVALKSGTDAEIDPVGAADCIRLRQNALKNKINIAL
jgi:hypothetical protein